MFGLVGTPLTTLLVCQSVSVNMLSYLVITYSHATSIEHSRMLCVCVVFVLYMLCVPSCVALYNEV